VVVVVAVADVEIKETPEVLAVMHTDFSQCSLEM
jgi:hypothetical protein